MKDHQGGYWEWVSVVRNSHVHLGEGGRALAIGFVMEHLISGIHLTSYHVLLGGESMESIF